jgi:prolyl 4-hydroxylase
VILESSCTHCGTNFPTLQANCDAKGPSLNDIVDCADERGLTVKPILGSALFWRNRHNNGTGDNRTLHAGLPLGDGIKIGLNIWTSINTDTFKRIYASE